MTDEHCTDGVGVSAAHGLLRSAVRRAVLRELRDRDSEQVTLQSLTRSVPSRLPDPACQSLRSELYHEHLPRLAADGVVDFDTDKQVVRYVGDVTVERLLAVEGESGV